MANTLAGSQNQLASNSVTLAGVTANNLLTLDILWQGGGGATTLNSISDTQGNTWTIHASTKQYSTPLTEYIQQASCTAGSSGSITVTVTLSTGTAKQLFLREWNNGAGILTFDAGSANAGNSSTLNSNTATASAANSLGVSLCTADASVGGAFTTPSAGWTDHTASTPYWYSNGLYNLDLGAAGSKSAGESLVSGASKNWAANIGIYKVSAGGGIINLTVANLTQANLASTPAITQTHVIAVSNLQQANLISTAAITLGGTLTVANLQQANQVSTPAITQTHILVVANLQQSNLLSSPAIGLDTVTLVVPGITQVNLLASAEISQDYNFSWIPDDAVTGSWTKNSAYTNAWS